MFEQLSILASLEISKIASSLLAAVKVGKGIAQFLTKSDLEKAIKAGAKAVDQWDKKLDNQQRLFFHAPPDGWNGVNNFLRNYFTNSAVVAELQKPLINQGKPDCNFLVRLFQQQAEANKIKLNQKASLPDWVETFVNAYFQHTATYLKFQVAKQDYCQQLANWFDDVTFAGIAVAGQEVEKSEKLAQIFVMPDVVEEVSTARDLELEPLAEESGEQPERTLFKKTIGREFLAEQLLIQNQSIRVVILGAPGSGKTTLMSYFTVMLAQSKPEVLGLDPDTDWLPILIRIRDWQRYLDKHLDKSLIDYARGFAEKTMAVKPLPKGFFDHWLSDGRALILLDGLDEVAEDAKRHDVVRRINNFLGQFDRNRAIITSRPAGYRRYFFRTEDFPHYQIQPFDDQKISTFIDNWYKSRCKDQAEAERRKQSLGKALEDNDRIKLLARNPLLLTIIALIHRYQAVLPKKRHKLYDKAVETLLTNWDELKDLSSDKRLKYLDFEDDLRRLMESLAYWIHSQGNVENNDSGTLIDQDDLINQLKEQIKTMKGLEFHKAEREAKRFVELIRERTGLLNEQGQDCYGFVHKTFQEYLCAQEIKYQALRKYDFDKILNPIRNHLHDSHWREVLLLLIAQQTEEHAATAIRAVLNNSNYEQWLHRDLLFAGNCLAENPNNLRSADRELVQDILERLVELEVSSNKRVGENIPQQVYQIICSLSETDFQAQVLKLLKERSDQIDEERLLKYRAELGEKDQVIEIWLERLKDNESDVRTRAANVLGKLGNSSQTLVNGLLALLQDNRYYVRSKAALALGRLGNSSQTLVNALLALLQDNESYVRRNAALALGILDNSSETVVNLLLPLLQDNDSSVREQTAEVLRHLGNNSETVVKALLPLLQDNHSGVRSGAAKVLGRLDNSSETIVKALLPLLQDNRSDVGITAAFALVNLGNSSETVVNLLQELLQDPDAYHRLRAADALGRLGNSSKVVNALLPLLQDNHSGVRVSTAEVLGRLDNSSEVVNALLPLLQDPDSDVRQTAVQSLENLGNSSETVVNALLPLLQDPNSDVRQTAVQVLGELGNSSETVVNALLPLLQDPNSGVRWGSALALSALGNSSETVVSTLLARLNNPNSGVRGAAALALGMLLNTSETVVSALLERLQEDHDSVVRWRAAQALINLGNSSESLVSTLLAWLQDEKFYLRRDAALALVKLGNSSETVVSALLAMLNNPDSGLRRRAAIALGKLGKTSNHVLPTVIEWIEQHQDSDYVGSGIDVLWDLVVDRE
ncbi:HEAT repeat domain-containing protein [Moorena producens]|uniref:HEAT repeat domain-containing protein n=1 Tax=Moorena producens TaxID=1155739 RepID=UPI0009F4E9A0|nr:HEAT repeat domain-containing protein [Moorena producens]